MPSLHILLILQLEAFSYTSLILGTVLGIAGGLSAFLVARTYYKTQLEEKLTSKYKQLYEAEKADNDRLTRAKGDAEKERDIAQQRLATFEQEKADLLLDYTQLTQLFATKSVILEQITGFYTKVAQTLQSGDPQAYKALMRFLSPKDMENTHRTNPPE